MKLRTYIMILCLSLTFFGCGAEQKAREQISKGLELVRLERYEDAINTFHEAIRLKSDLPEAHYELGRVYLKQRNFDQAIECYQKATLLNPDFAEAYSDMGFAYFCQERRGDAKESFMKALHMKPDQIVSTTGIPAQTYIGTIYYGLGEVESAIAAYLKSIDLHPKNPKAHYDLGYIYMEQSRWNEASDALQTVIRIDSGSGIAAAAEFGLMKCQTHIDPARDRLTEYGYNRISSAFANASPNFQYLIAENIMSYGEFIQSPLDKQIKRCNELGKVLEMDELTWSLALQEWLRTDARTVAIIASY